MSIFGLLNAFHQNKVGEGTRITGEMADSKTVFVVKREGPVSLDSLVAILRVRNYSTPEDDVSQGRSWLGSISI